MILEAVLFNGCTRPTLFGPEEKGVVKGARRGMCGREKVGQALCRRRTQRAGAACSSAAVGGLRARARRMR